ncbi:DinB family protein [Actinoplanes sp. NPDC048791]|uniref:DinB family protein n=1 Tax=Actinoplanes sp. NPDC048791 TaxID=3154623 RepID=UPI0033C1B20B
MGQPPWTRDLRVRLDELLDQHRWSAHDSLKGMSEDEARASLVPSRTTLLGLVKHLTYVERFYFGHVLTGRSLKELGVAATPGHSFILRPGDTIESVQAAHRTACEESRAAVRGLGLEHVVSGRKVRSMWALYVQVLRELAQHCGHADILREQLLAARPRRTRVPSA